MKKTYLILLSIIFGTSVFAQNCTNCEGTTTSGDNASAIGTSTKAEGEATFASGYFSEATYSGATAIGFHARSTAASSIALGIRVKASAAYSMVIGKGGPWNENIFLENNMTSSLMIGFGSTKPTFYVSTSPNTTGSYNQTGRIAIGNVVNQNGHMVPLAKLHIRSDSGEEAAIFIEPNNWNAGEAAKIMLGDTNHFISTNRNLGIKFHSENNFVFSGNNSGFGVEEPKAKVHINGDLLFEQSLNGIIMKSEDGNCWKGTISNNGELIFTQVDCETLSSTENITEPKHSEVFIYPNPTNGKMKVEYTGNKKNLRLEIKSISGHLVATYKIKKGENRIELNNISDQMVVASLFTRKGELISTNKVVIKK